MTDRRDKEEGAVLLTTLLVMGIMAALAVSIIDQVRFAVKRAGNVQAYAQADWYMRGAEDFAQQYIEDQIENVKGEQLNEILRSGVPVILPIEGGAITLSVRDGGQCLSLNSVAGKGQGSIMLRQLLESVGWDSIDAARQTPIIQDWVDENSDTLPGGAEDFTYLGQSPAYRTPNAPFTSISELRLIEGMTEEKYQRLRPFVCARAPSTSDDPDSIDQNSQININSLSQAQAPILASILGGFDHLQRAEQLILDRPSGGYQDDSFKKAALDDEEEEGDILTSFVAYEPNYLWVEARVEYLTASRIAAYEFSIDNGRVTRLYRGTGEEALRPILKSETP